MKSKTIRKSDLSILSTCHIGKLLDENIGDAGSQVSGPVTYCLSIKLRHPEFMLPVGLQHSSLAHPR